MIESNFILPTVISACGVIVTAACAINRNSLVRSKAREELAGKLMENNDGKHCPYGFSESDKTKFAEYYVSERFI